MMPSLGELMGYQLADLVGRFQQPGKCTTVQTSERAWWVVAAFRRVAK